MSKLISETIIETLKFVFPAYCANAAPVIFKGRRAIDMGKKFVDGKQFLEKIKHLEDSFQD